MRPPERMGREGVGGVYVAPFTLVVCTTNSMSFDENMKKNPNEYELDFFVTTSREFTVCVGAGGFVNQF